MEKIRIKSRIKMLKKELRSFGSLCYFYLKVWIPCLRVIVKTTTIIIDTIIKKNPDPLFQMSFSVELPENGKAAMSCSLSLSFRSSSLSFFPINTVAFKEAWVAESTSTTDVCSARRDRTPQWARRFGPDRHPSNTTIEHKGVLTFFL